MPDALVFPSDHAVPVSDADPFSAGFFENPHPIHDELREAGPVVRLSRYGVLASLPVRLLRAA